MEQKEQMQSSSTNPADRIIELYKAIHKIFRDQLWEKSKKYGFTGPQIGLIFGLYKKPYITLHELSEHVGLSKSTVSDIVERLVVQGVVIREIPSDNRRIVRLSLSPEFLKNNDLIDLKNKYIEGIIKMAGPKDIEDIITGLEKLYSLMK